MARYDYTYIKSLIRDIQVGDSDAFAGLFAATYQDQYQKAFARVQNDFDAQEVLQKLYSNVLASDANPVDPKVFLAALDQYNANLCGQILDARLTPAVIPLDRAPKLDRKGAEILMDYILNINHWEPASFTMDTLISYSKYRTSRSTVQRILLVMIILFFCFVPMLFIPPSFTITEESAANADPTYRLNVQAIAPINKITALIDGKSMQIAKNTDGTYTVQPTANGDMTVTVTLETSQKATHTVTVTEVDRDLPVLTDQRISGNLVVMTVTDSGTGVNFDSIYAVTDNGVTVKPVSINAATGEVTFEKPDGSYNVYISDQRGNTLHVILRVVS